MHTLKYFKHSLMDYFVDEELKDSPKAANAIIHIIHQSIRTNLENLLNTYRACESWSPELTELTHSILNYGIDDFNRYELSSANARAALCFHLEEIISQFESRLTQIKVTFDNQFDELSRTIKLNIEAILRVKSYAERIVFSSNLNKENGQFSVCNELY